MDLQYMRATDKLEAVVMMKIGLEAELIVRMWAAMSHLRSEIFDLMPFKFIFKKKTDLIRASRENVKMQP